jgi:kinesin family protein 2/24
MEQYILDNVDRYKKLVAEFRPTASGPQKSDATETSPEIVVSARVRPMLEDELSQGFPVGVYIRDGTNTADLHELQQPVRGPAKIRVRVASIIRMIVNPLTMGSLSTTR